MLQKLFADEELRVLSTGGSPVDKLRISSDAMTSWILCCLLSLLAPSPALNADQTVSTAVDGATVLDLVSRFFHF